MPGPHASGDEATSDSAGPRRFTLEALQRCTRLTRRERDVLEAFATGALTDEVAQRLRISGEDVRTHVRNAIRVLQVRSKIEAVLLALAAGMVDEPRD